MTRLHLGRNRAAQRPVRRYASAIGPFEPGLNRSCSIRRSRTAPRRPACTGARSSPWPLTTASWFSCPPLLPSRKMRLA